MASLKEQTIALQTEIDTLKQTIQTTNENNKQLLQKAEEEKLRIQQQLEELIKEKEKMESEYESTQNQYKSGTYYIYLYFLASRSDCKEWFIDCICFV